MRAGLAVTAIATASGCLATPTKRWSQSNAECQSFYAGITAEAQNFDLQSVIGSAPANEQAWEQSFIDTYAAGSTIQDQIAGSAKLNTSGTYQLWFEYCAPKNGDRPKGIFEAIHGVVGNAGYWNAMVDNKTDNSFVESATAAGWATLSYDRLGVGRSDHPDGIQVVQLPYEAAQAAVISQMLYSGSLGNGVPAFNTIVGIGHSYGSGILASLAHTMPDTFNASILTGFTGNLSNFNLPLGLPGFASELASGAYPNRFGNLSNGYLSTPDATADHRGFFHYPNFTDNALEVFTTTKGEYSIGQVQSAGAPLPDPIGTYDKPTLIATGDKDAPFCASNCYVTSLGDGKTQIDSARAIFPNISDSNWQINVIPDTGHGINFHTTAYSAYQGIIDFVAAHL